MGFRVAAKGMNVRFLLIHYSAMAVQARLED